MKIVKVVLSGFMLGAVLPMLAQNPKVTSLWATDKVFDVPESALYAHTEKLIFVSNISGNPTDKDGNGFISTLSPTGKVFNLKWIEGLNAPKGMVLVGKSLFVSDIDELVEIDIDGRKIVQRYQAAQGKFLNDVAATSDGAVYVSDTDDQSIYQLKNGIFTKWLSSDALAGVNGLAVEGDTLFAGTPKGIVSITLPGMEVSVWAGNTGRIDGLAWNGSGAFLYSDWQGKTYWVQKGQKPIMVLNTTADKVNAADIGFNKEKGILYVPSFFDNRVMAYKVEH
ncbi:MAG: hypothetical protein QM786_15030 [Breznakibacter sp.]